jgi:hypothetical protein
MSSESLELFSKKKKVILYFGAEMFVFRGTHLRRIHCWIQNRNNKIRSIVHALARCTFIHIHKMYIYIYIHTYVQTPTYIHIKCIYIYIYIYMHTYIHTQNAYIYIYIYAYVHTYT